MFHLLCLIFHGPLKSSSRATRRVGRLVSSFGEARNFRQRFQLEPTKTGRRQNRKRSRPERRIERWRRKFPVDRDSAENEAAQRTFEEKSLRRKALGGVDRFPRPGYSSFFHIRLIHFYRICLFNCNCALKPCPLWVHDIARAAVIDKLSF